MGQDNDHNTAAHRRRRRLRLAAMLLIVAAIAVAGILYLYPHKPSIKVAGAKIERLTFTRLDMVFLLNVANPTRMPIRLRDISFDLASIGGQVVSGVVPAGLDIAAGQSTQVSLPVNIDYSRLLPQLKHLRTQEPLPFDLTVRGAFDAAVTIPVTYVHRGYFYPSRVPQCELRKVRFSKHNGLEMDVVLAVTNPNDIDLKIERVWGSVKLGARPVIELDHAISAALPAGQTVDVTIPVNVDTSKLAAALLAGRKGLRFEGQFKLGEPSTWRKMLLGKRE